MGELDGIADQVGDHLAQAHRVAAHFAGHVLGNVAGDFQALGLRAFGKQFDHVVDVVAHRKGDVLEVEFAGLDLGEVENVVDDLEQLLAGALRGLGQVALVVGERRFQQQLGHAQNAVHRRPDLVAHVGKELRLGDVGGFGSLLGAQQLGGLLAQLTRSALHRLFERVLMVMQLPVAPLDFIQHFIERGGQGPELVVAAPGHPQRKILVPRYHAGSLDQVENRPDDVPAQFARHQQCDQESHQRTNSGSQSFVQQVGAQRLEIHQDADLADALIVEHHRPHNPRGACGERGKHAQTGGGIPQQHVLLQRGAALVGDEQFAFFV